MSRLAIIAILTAVVFLLGNLWMSLTTYSYVKLHLFILVPVALLFFVPPCPLSKANPGVRQFGYISMLLLAVIAVTYSVVGWDHILFKAGVVSCPSSLGSLHDVPYEECFWCIDYTLLISLWVMSIWLSRPVSQIRGDPCVGFRAASTLVCLTIAYYGYFLQGQGEICSILESLFNIHFLSWQCCLLQLVICTYNELVNVSSVWFPHFTRLLLIL